MKVSTSITLPNLVKIKIPVITGIFILRSSILQIPLKNQIYKLLQLKVGNFVLENSANADRHYLQYY